ncbi:MAG TPA: formate dehydrogenase accessory protein FdhE [Terriglobales bacterium]|jgi:FdhE protein|nr:formate dehydrogenase accessory protein FdhE [Terriglobales bacterium]
MAFSRWQQRIERAQQLARKHPFAAEILGFYLPLAAFQEDLFRRLTAASQEGKAAPSGGPFDAPPELPGLLASFGPFLALVERSGPARLKRTACELRDHGDGAWSNLLKDCWAKTEAAPAQPAEFLAYAFLQPYAEFVRSRIPMRWEGYTYSRCPFCNRRPGVGVLRQQGDGARRSLICSFCLAEWEFRRIVCPGCGEEDNRKLPVYSAAEFDYIRVEGCDSCKQYLKTVDLTKDGLAEPLVDELASAPLDLWAQENGYSKLQPNLLAL